MVTLPPSTAFSADQQISASPFFFFAIKKNGADFFWNNECEAAFQSLKAYLASPPLLSKPRPDETLLLYLAVSDTAVCATLIQEDGDIQKLVWYVSKALIDAQVRHTRIEKLVFALFIITRKLKHYFQPFPIVMLIEYPLRTIVENPRPTTESQSGSWRLDHLESPLAKNRNQRAIMANFISTFTPGTLPQNNSMKRWILNMDGALNNKGARVRVVLTTPYGSIIEQSYTLGFQATNNEAEYESVIMSLKMTTALGIAALEVQRDSLLIVSQINREYTVEDNRMAAYLKIVMT